VAFLGLHIVTAIVDGYAHIPWLSTVVPFTSGYERFWIGLGTAAVDLFAALIITSLLRDRLRASIWRAIHWLAYVAYPVVVIHSFGAYKDLRSGWLLALTMATVFAVVTAIGYRVLDALSAIPRPGRVPVQFAQTDHIRADKTGSLR
jgi:sulfoxide reductase heme-binding subunit YedZ